MKIIDAHLHFADREGFKRTARDISQVDFSAEGLEQEFEQANVVAGVVMMSGGRDPRGESREMMVDSSSLESLVSCVGINPVQLQEEEGELDRIISELNSPYVTGIKIYAGYNPYYAYDAVYLPIYELAREFGLPVAIHCGDTSSPRAHLKYSHPLTIDELAVAYPDVDFIVCHFGDPWVMDTAELITKNPNVYADLSGLMAGNWDHVKERMNTRLFCEHIQRALIYADRYDKVLFGTDWPLVPIKPYVDFVKSIVPSKYHEQVFYSNAARLFPKIEKLIIRR